MRVSERIFGAFVALATACAPASQRWDGLDASPAIDSVNARVARAYALKDPAAYAALFTDSAVFEWPAVPTVRGRAGLEAMARDVWSPLTNIELRITPASRRVVGDHATEFGAFEESWDGDSARRHTEYGRYASTFLRQRNGEWLMEHFLAFEDSTRAHDRFIDVAGTRVHYVESGRGAPVVLVHGIGGGIADWTESGVLQALAKDFHVIALDLRGHGRSAKPHDPAAYGRELALDIARLLDSLHIDRAAVVGYSLGANIAALFVTLKPERVTRAVLIAGRMRFHWTESEQRDADVEAEEEERFCISPTLMRRLAPRDVVLSDSVLAERSAACMADATRDRFAVAALTRSRMAHTLDSARVASLRVPMLAIVGTQDANRASLEQLHAIRPDVEVRVVDGATHAGPRGILRRPETLDAIRAYLGAMAR